MLQGKCIRFHILTSVLSGTSCNNSVCEFVCPAQIVTLNSMDPFEIISKLIANHPMNTWARELGYEPVFTASAAAKIMIVGQAPGRIAQTTKKPWNDVSGVRLRRWLGISDELFYDSSRIALVPMDFYYPGKGKHGDLPPRPGFASQWHPLLLKHMPNIELIVLVGRYSQNYYLQKSAKRTLSETVAAYEVYAPHYFPLVHPSPLNFRWLSKNPWFEAKIVSQLRARVHEILEII